MVIGTGVSGLPVFTEGEASTGVDGEGVKYELVTDWSLTSCQSDRVTSVQVHVLNATVT